MKELLEKLEQSKQEIKNYIIQRARMYIDNGEELSDKYIDKNYELYDIDMDKEPICNYDSEDMSNHTFDLGGLYQLKWIIKDVKNKL